LHNKGDQPRRKSQQEDGILEETATIPEHCT
jgi:hypothetical protein